MPPRLKKNRPIKPQTNNPPSTSWFQRCLILSFMASIFLGSLQIYLANTIGTHGDEIQSQETRLRELNQQICQLEKQINASSSLSYIEKRAREDLEMVKIKKENVVYIRPDYFASLP